MEINQGDRPLATTGPSRPDLTRASGALRSIALVAFAMLLILVLLPAALVAAGS
jgi:hypothetical protein